MNDGVPSGVVAGPAADLAALSLTPGVLWVAEGERDPFVVLGAFATAPARPGVLLAPWRSGRHPSIVAKQMATLDVLTGGRSLLGLDARGDLDPGVLDEALAIVRAMGEDGPTTFEGVTYQVIEARNEPRPLQGGALPLVVFVDHDVAPSVLEVAQGRASALVVAAEHTFVRALADEMELPVQWWDVTTGLVSVP